MKCPSLFSVSFFLFILSFACLIHSTLQLSDLDVIKSKVDSITNNANIFPENVHGILNANATQFKPPRAIMSQDDVSIYVMSALAITCGLILMFLGYALIKVALLLLGFLAPIALLFPFLTINTDLPPWAIILISIIVGIVSAVICFFLFKVGLFIAGAILGLLLSLLVLSMIHYNGSNSHYVDYIVIGVSALVIGILTVLFEKLCLVLVTSFTGSTFLVMGIDLSAFKGFYTNIIFNTLFNSNLVLPTTDHPYWGIYIFFVLVLLFCLPSFLVQYRTSSKAAPFIA